ncbi:MAG: RagB/SusD family nutrient uptake outer membrane protein [Prevotella sp.]|nr:RagB/SusD family nutrient uptake outer membrane protein [Prevotella sp.]
MCVACMATALTSCLDTIILPDDKTVDEDFWQSKSDVALMVNAAYAAMTAEDVVSKLIVWGGMRGDEYAFGDDALNNNAVSDMQEIMSASVQTNNSYASWASMYAVINRCNIVLERAQKMYAEGVDPNYTEGDYLVDRSQMLALRSLCYFYLVRAFRDVPYVDAAFMTSSQDRNLLQSSPDVVLQHCIADLEEAAKNALSPLSYGRNNWRRVGWITSEGIHSILADIYLWRASVKNSADDYQKCIDYCDLVIESKQKNHVTTPNETKGRPYPALAEGCSRIFSATYRLFSPSGNDEESIFELQSTGNAAVCKSFYKFKDNNSASGLLEASSIFQTSTSASNITKAVDAQVYPTNDVRYYTYLYKASSGAESFAIRKMTAEDDIQTAGSSIDQVNRPSGRAFSGYDQNYIVYRLADILLMKAEALVQQAVDTTGMSTDQRKVQDSINQVRYTAAYRLVTAVNSRSIWPSTSSDTLKQASLASMDRAGSKMELLVLEERLRELCFEGKRWFDLMRYNYRHMEKRPNYSTILGSQSEASIPANTKEMLDIMVRNRGGEGAGVKAKMRNEAYLYMPIPYNDIILNGGLKQNPAYASTTGN